VQRKARNASLSGVAVLAALLVGCTGGSGTGDAAEDAKPGDSGTTAAAEPGRYTTLPEPCGSVGRAALEQLLPGVSELTQEQQEKAYEGRATLTYDTDRHVGCRWKLDSTDGTRHLHVDFERVVSYDHAVSDDDRADKVYGQRLLDADIPAITPRSATPSPPVSPSASEGGEEASASPTTPESGSGLASRVLDDLGDAAFLEDELSKSGSTVQTRTVTVVFRSSNVIVTIEYAQQPGRITDVPDSKELQDKALDLADQLAEQFSD
jgi:hypothetical protein